MSKGFLMVIVTVFTSLLLFQCMSTPADKPMIVVDKAKVDAIIKDFNVVCYSMLKGDIKTVYDKYLSASIQESQSYDAFVNDYNINKENYKRLFSGAMLKQISPEDKLASALVVWGSGGEPSVIEFAKENNTWKINYLRGPAVVFDQNVK
ncbi:MAG: hypothetical protein V1709_11460 [Planctomycetota bacterium]